jgi:hypothetical protein
MITKQVYKSFCDVKELFVGYVFNELKLYKKSIYFLVYIIIQ